jgi:DNA-binding SARP family transcriptional activator
MAKIRIYIAGRVAVEIDGQLALDESKFRGSQPKLIFTYLVMNRGLSVTRDELANILWPDRLPSGWDSSLNALISRMRSLLSESIPDGDKWLSLTSGDYLMTIPIETWVDIEVLRKSMGDVESALQSGLLSNAWGPANVSAVIAKRPFLQGLDSEWIAETRDWSGRQYIRALECLAIVLIDRKQIAPAVEILSQIISADPYRESSHLMLIQAHLLEGNRAQGVLVYNQLRERLDSELQVEPSAETQAMYKQLVD